MFNFLSLLTTLLASAAPHVRVIPIETDPVDTLILSMDDLDLRKGEPDHFLDLWTTAIREANRQNIQVYIHVIEKSDADAVEEELLRRGLDFTMSPYRTDSVWIRDFGPTLFLDDGKPVVFDYSYFDRRPLDDAQPAEFAEEFGMDFTHSGLYMEGGNLLTNGRGMCVTSDTVLNFNFPWIKTRSRKARTLRRILALYGCPNTLILDSLEDEATGHVDIWLAFATPTNIIAGVFTEEQHAANRDIQLRNIELLREAGLEVTTIPMPDPVVHEGKLVLRTYANMLPLGDVVLVPRYDGHEGEGVVRIIEEAMGKRVVLFHGEHIIKERGTVHCLSKTIPRVDRATK